MYELLVCVQLLWHDHSGLGEAGRRRPVELRGDESPRTEDMTSGIINQSAHRRSTSCCQAISPSSRRDVHARVIHAKSYHSTSMTRDGMKRAASNNITHLKLYCTVRPRRGHDYHHHPKQNIGAAEARAHHSSLSQMEPEKR
jgi:hypothetical protein